MKPGGKKKSPDREFCSCIPEREDPASVRFARGPVVARRPAPRADLASTMAGLNPPRASVPASQHARLSTPRGGRPSMEHVLSTHRFFRGTKKHALTDASIPVIPTLRSTERRLFHFVFASRLRITPSSTVFVRLCLQDPSTLQNGEPCPRCPDGQPGPCAVKQSAPDEPTTWPA